MLSCAWSSAGQAQEAISLAEVLPVLQGTELGELEVGPAPAPGDERTVRRREVLAALRRAGRSADGLRIPRAKRIRREARVLEAEALRVLFRSALSARLSPCSIERLRVPDSVTVADGELEVRSDVRPPRRSGSVSASVLLEAGGQVTRVAVRATLRCPPPLVQPGRRVRVVAVVGNVRASVPGTARQAGRVGDVIKVTRSRAGVSLRARVIDAQTVEVVR